MKYKIVELIGIVFFFLSCSSKNNDLKNNIISTSNKVIDSVEIGKNKNANDLYKYAIEYQPKHLSLEKDINDTLNNYDLNYIFEKGDPDSLLFICKVFLLKQYLYQIKTANQGFNLYIMRVGSAKIIIDYYLLTNNLDTSRKSWTSSIPFTIEETKNNKTFIRDLISQIKSHE